ncbi:MAG: CARDB domain-containing protein, partial [Candidatus Marinimicrobia bacterium]|nr:CARDB domain-containing protein [Candidatus Neomarinimicrobiota bacterium]
MQHTDCGALGVFAGSNSSSIYSYKYYGKGILTAVFERGITRMGDAILSARLQHLDVFMEIEGGIRALAQFNLLGDPAADIGDRMKFRDCCDLIISPADLEMNLYSTMNVNGSGEVILYATVRNAGWQNAGSFEVSLEVTDGNIIPDILTAQCPGLASGDETTLEFQWNNTWFAPPGTLYLTASATDPGGIAPDSWMPNNSATKSLEITDFYPNETGWPTQTAHSTIIPPALCDFDGGGDLEIVITTENQICVYRSDSPGAPIWESGCYFMFNTPSAAIWPSIPAVGNVVGDGLSDIVVDGQDELMIFNTTSTAPISSFTHSGEWFWVDNHTVALADFVDEADFETRDEIVLVRGRELQVFDVINDDLVAIRTVQLPGIPADANTISSWPLLKDLNGDGNMDIVVSLHYNVFMQADHSVCFVYDYDADDFISERDWSGVQWRTVPAVGALPQGQVVALPTDLSTSAQNPALLLDPGDLTTSAECQRNIGLDSYHVPYCIMADWDPLTPGLDRVISNTENQCFAWDEGGDHRNGFPHVYSSAGLSRPPFPALGELDDHDRFDYADVITATREGTVFGISSGGSELINLGFPYTLPASVRGGFVIADIDNDGKVEVVFGTMDNYIH